MALEGWIHKFAMQDDALAADTIGRAAMEDSFITNAKIADLQITVGKFASGTLITGLYGTGVYGTSIYG